MANKNRAKGHRAELHYVKRFNEIGYDKVITSRLGSRLHDSCGIDLLYTPVLVQIKSGYNQLNHRTVLSYTDERVKESFSDNPNMLNKPIVLIHHRDRLNALPGKPRGKFDTIVSMAYDDFEKMMLLAYPPNK